MSDKYFRENEWWVSPYNFVPEVRNTYQLPKSVSIHDATLRDGEQTPGVVMSIKEKVAIAEKLDEIGVDRIEAGMPASPSRTSRPSSKSRSWGSSRRSTPSRAPSTPISTRPSNAAAMA
jgi:methanogen homocitrate synthase